MRFIAPETKSQEPAPLFAELALMDKQKALAFCQTMIDECTCAIETAQGKRSSRITIAHSVPPALIRRSGR